MRLALYQPDIAPNVGTLVRLGACLGVPIDVIEPCGFTFSAQSFRRAVLDYGHHAEVVAHRSFERFLAERSAGRLVLLSTTAELGYCDFTFRSDDHLLVGRESGGVPDEVHGAADAAVTIPMRAGLRSLNVAIAASMVLGEAMRQTRLFPPRQQASPA